jgi:RNA recognition motif-containing protein
MSYDGQGANRSSNQVARTIYVGNLNLAIDEDALRQFFSSAGTVTATKMAGEADGKQTRFAFVEFDTPEQAQMALTLQGTVLADKAIKVGKAVNPIQKNDEPSKNINEIMRKVLAHTERLSKDIERSRSRSRDRGGRRRRSRSRDSRDRHRDRRRSRSRSPPREIVVPRARKEDKPKVDRTGMFFDGYRWQPIQPVLPGMSSLPAATKLFGIPPGQVNQPPQGR